MKYYLLIPLFFFLSCSRYIDLYSLEYVILEWDEIPDSIKPYYKDKFNTGFINLDYGTYAEYKNTSLTGIKSGKHIFSIENKKYFFYAKGNKENAPYVFKDGKLYVLYSETGGVSGHKSDETLSVYKYYCFTIL